MLSFSISPPLADVLDISQVAGNFGGSFMDVVQYNMDNTAFEVHMPRANCFLTAMTAMRMAYSGMHGTLKRMVDIAY